MSSRRAKNKIASKTLRVFPPLQFINGACRDQCSALQDKHARISCLRQCFSEHQKNKITDTILESLPLSEDIKQATRQELTQWRHRANTADELDKAFIQNVTKGKVPPMSYWKRAEQFYGQEFPLVDGAKMHRQTLQQVASVVKQNRSVLSKIKNVVKEGFSVLLRVVRTIASKLWKLIAWCKDNVQQCISIAAMVALLLYSGSVVYKNGLDGVQQIIVYWWRFGVNILKGLFGFNEEFLTGDFFMEHVYKRTVKTATGDAMLKGGTCLAMAAPMAAPAAAGGPLGWLAGLGIVAKCIVMPGLQAHAENQSMKYTLKLVEQGVLQVIVQKHMVQGIAAVCKKIGVSEEHATWIADGFNGIRALGLGLQMLEKEFWTSLAKAAGTIYSSSMLAMVRDREQTRQLDPNYDPKTNTAAIADKMAMGVVRTTDIISQQIKVPLDVLLHATLKNVSLPTTIDKKPTLPMYSVKKRGHVFGRWDSRMLSIDQQRIEYYKSSVLQGWWANETVDLKSKGDADLVLRGPKGAEKSNHARENEVFRFEEAIQRDKFINTWRFYLGQHHRGKFQKHQHLPVAQPVV